MRVLLQKRSNNASAMILHFQDSMDSRDPMFSQLCLLRYQDRISGATLWSHWCWWAKGSSSQSNINPLQAREPWQAHNASLSPSPKLFPFSLCWFVCMKVAVPNLCTSASYRAPTTAPDLGHFADPISLTNSTASGAARTGGARLMMSPACLNIAARWVTTCDVLGVVVDIHHPFLFRLMDP